MLLNYAREKEGGGGRELARWVKNVPLHSDEAEIWVDYFETGPRFLIIFWSELYFKQQHNILTAKVDNRPILQRFIRRSCFRGRPFLRHPVNRAPDENSIHPAGMLANLETLGVPFQIHFWLAFCVSYSRRLYMKAQNALLHPKNLWNWANNSKTREIELTMDRLEANDFLTKMISDDRSKYLKIIIAPPTRTKEIGGRVKRKPTKATTSSR